MSVPEVTIVPPAELKEEREELINAMLSESFQMARDWLKMQHCIDLCRGFDISEATLSEMQVVQQSLYNKRQKLDQLINEVMKEG
jgi:2-phospho-L-lactate guanylyltransferase (CobY/MobA/RfbA family)